MPGDVLLSQGLASQLPSALKSLTSVFGMGTGVTSSPSPPDYFVSDIYYYNMFLTFFKSFFEKVLAFFILSKLDNVF